MGEVIRPAAFVRAPQSTSRALPAAASSRREPRRRLYRIDIQVAAIAFGIGAVAWILALAGAAFAMRAMLVLVFTMLANRPRWQPLHVIVRRRR